MKTITIISIVLFLTTSFLYSQETYKKSTSGIYIELLGNGYVWTGNYEFKVIQNTRMRFGLGYSTLPLVFVDPAKLLAFPVMLNYITGNGDHHFEFGSGFTGMILNILDDSNLNIDLSVVVGYRYQKPGKGIIFRAGLTPLLPVVYPDDRPVWLLPAFSFGLNL